MASGPRTSSIRLMIVSVSTGLRGWSIMIVPVSTGLRGWSTLKNVH